MEAKLLLIPWMVSVMYGSIPVFWFAIHPFARSWRRMNRSPYLLLLPAWAGIIFAIAWMTWSWHALLIYSSPWTWIPSAFLFLLGFRVYAGIGSGFGARRLTGEAELRPEEHGQELVTSGLHSRMRHPIYVAHLANLMGWALGSGLAIAWVLLGVSAIFTFPLMIWLEERELAARFGASYRAYKLKVPLVPRVFVGSARKGAA